jgi:hypothetical protein
MPKHLCIHGHFYQPPRVDPWLDEVLPEGSAAPFHDWNERICRECYAPVGYARRSDRFGAIEDMVNCYSWISFNFGPTLLTWLEHAAPETYARILEGDRESLARWGHGNALAQVYHHVIMPLSTELDRSLEVVWAIQDFRARFGRDSEGMWLAETAVDTNTLESLARANISFTILAPRQAKAVLDPGDGSEHPVTEATLDTTQAYRVSLPSGRSIAVFFYDGAISQGVAFERLLADGEQFWKRLADNHPGGLRNIATDGESYGHHFTFGEMALAYGLDQGRQNRDDIRLTNYAAWLADNPPTREILIHENSSWSCVHGVERWRSHCGCSNGEHPDWIQEWRRPLRRGLNYLKYYVDEHFFRAGSKLFQTPSEALTDYGRVRAGTISTRDFLDTHLHAGLPVKERIIALKLLAMQRWSLASFASCAWFFDDIGRIEPVNGLTFALRSLELLRETGGPQIEDGLQNILEEAESNDARKGTGQDIWNRQVLTRAAPPLDLVAMQVFSCWPDLPESVHSSALSITFADTTGNRETGMSGTVTWQQTATKETETASFSIPPSPSLSRTAIRFGENRTVTLADLDRRKQRAVLNRGAETREEKLWQTLVNQAETLGEAFLDFEEGQKVPQGETGALLPGLLWVWLREEVHLDRDDLDAMAAIVRTNPALTRMLENRVAREVTDLLRASPPDWPRLARILGRTKLLALNPDWWTAQNLLWEMDRGTVNREVARLLKVKRGKG